MTSSTYLGARTYMMDISDGKAPYTNNINGSQEKERLSERSKLDRSLKNYAVTSHSVEADYHAYLEHCLGNHLASIKKSQEKQMLNEENVNISTKEAVNGTCGILLSDSPGYGFSIAEPPSVRTIKKEVSPLLNGRLFDRMIKMASLMAESSCVPDFLRCNPGNCFMVVEFSHRVNQSPFAVAQSCFFVKGKMGFEGKLVAALVNSSPLIEGSLSYSIYGEVSWPETRICKVWGKKVGCGIQEISFSLASAMTSNQHWKSMPDQMMHYYGARMWARRYAPEVIMGLVSDDERDDMEAKEYAIRVNGIDVPRTCIEIKKQIESAATVEELSEIKSKIAKIKDIAPPSEIDDLRNIFVSKVREIKNLIPQDEKVIQDAKRHGE